MQLDTARSLYKSNPTTADALLVDLKAQVQSAITDIRRLVYALRPPSLDELGLVSALREQLTHYRQPGLSITLNAQEDLPPLPAAVEVAIYRIAQEALTNVVRHAGAQHCVLTLEVDDHICLEVRDDGRGSSPGQSDGRGSDIDARTGSRTVDKERDVSLSLLQTEYSTIRRKNIDKLDTRLSLEQELTTSCLRRDIVKQVDTSNYRLKRWKYLSFPLTCVPACQSSGASEQWDEPGYGAAMDGDGRNRFPCGFFHRYSVSCGINMSIWATAMDIAQIDRKTSP